MTKSRNQALSWIMALVMLTSVFFPISTAYAADVENILTDITSKISQNGTEIIEGGSLTSGDPITVELSFGVPVMGDYPSPDNSVKKGDTAAFELSNAFKLVSSASIDLKMGSITVGHVSFSTDPDNDNMLGANIIFDGDDEVFDGTDNTVSCKIVSNFEYDDSGEAGSEGDHIVTILNKTFTVVAPAPEIEYEVTKSGTADLSAKCINWTVDISATQANSGIDLAGYQFSDDLSAVGNYIADSFKVDDVLTTPTLDGDQLGYIFPSDSSSPQTIKFKTEIPDEKYYGTGVQSIINAAQLLDDENNVMEEAESSVSFTPKWIEKSGTSSDSGSGGVYDSKGRTITWTITANQMAATLNNVVITDILPSGLTLNSASWAKWDGTVWVNEAGIAPNASGEYEIGDINSQILLTIITNVPDEEYTTGTKTYTNSAKISWDSLPGTGIGSGNINVGVGYTAITKSGVPYTASRSIHWTVKVDTKGQEIPSLKVYDLLVYGSSTSGFSLSQATGFPTGISPTDLTARYDQKYIDGSLSGTGLSVTVYPIMQNSQRVADLLEITGLSTSVSNTFTFDSLVVNPVIFAGNTTPQVWNTASLFSSNTKLNAASNKVNYISNMLAKEMLKREAVSDPASGVNNKTTNAAEGYNYVDKSVIFRLSVDADNIDLSNMTDATGQALGAATIADTLPAGWEFTEIAPDKNYLIFAGNAGSTKSITASSTTPLDVVEGLSADFSTAGTAKFTFSDLNSRYVILVKAKPTDETLSGYFDTNKTTTVRNNLSLSTVTWTACISSFQDVSITSSLLEKSMTIPEAGQLLWTVDYKPYDLIQPGTRLEDTLPEGLDIRTDSSGMPLLSDGNISAYEMSLNADGSYILGAEVTLTIGDNIFYDNATRVLTFLIADSAKAYRFIYLTDITGEPGTVSNHVSLYGDSTKQEETTQPYIITNADGEATLQRNGWIDVIKIDADGFSLSGAEFTLFASDGETVIRKGITDSSGTLRFKVIPDGQYILRETAAPAGYILDGRIHTLTVTTTGFTSVATIDGNTGTDSNTITIRNHLEGTVGNLTISKTVAGNAGDNAKQFDFTVTFDDADSTYYYIGNGVPDGSVKSGDTISLTHGQSITITGLPKGTSYTVSEEDYSNSGYSTTSTGKTGIIDADTTQVASFTNTKNNWDPSQITGSLTISKTVAGDGADTSRAFDFTVNLSCANGSYRYTGNGVPSGSIKSGDTIALAHGQSITIAGLPKGTQYQVTEEEASAQGYSVESAGSSGTISYDQDRTAVFTNTKISDTTASLTISKTVTGEGADLSKKFDFTITLTGAQGTYPYTGAYSGTLRSGDTVSLADEESVVITGLPDGATYSIEEADYSDEGYTSSSVGATGILSAATSQTASFKNSWSDAPIKPETPEDPSEDIGDENIPQGSMEGGEGGEGGQSGENGMPKTGDNLVGDFAQIGLFFFSAALIALCAVDISISKKQAKKRKH